MDLPVWGLTRCNIWNTLMMALRLKYAGHRFRLKRLEVSGRVQFIRYLSLIMGKLIAWWLMTFINQKWFFESSNYGLIARMPYCWWMPRLSFSNLTLIRFECDADKLVWRRNLNWCGVYRRWTRYFLTFVAGILRIFGVRAYYSFFNWGMYLASHWVVLAGQGLTPWFRRK